MAQQDLSVSLIGKDVSASDAFRALARAANQAAKSAGDSLDGMNRRIENSSQSALRSTTSTFGSGLMSWAQSGLAGILGGITASVTSTVTGVLADAGQAIMSQLKSSVIDYNSQLEQATIGFTTMLGSSGKAQAFLDELQAFAKRTPFGFADLTNYSQQMIGYGIASKNVIPYLTALGDAAAGAGKSSDELGNAVLAFEQMAARGKVDLGNLNQLANAGIPAQAILADKYNVSKGELMDLISSSKIMADDALPKLIDGIEHGTKSTAAFGGMMDKQSMTLQGAMSNIQDAMDQTLSKAFLPFFRVAERGANTLASFAGSNQVTAWANNTSRAMGRLVTQVGRVFNQIGQDKGVQASLARLGAAFDTAFAEVGPTLRRMLPNLARAAQQLIPALADSIGSVVSHLPQLLSGIEAGVREFARFAPVIAGAIRAGTGFIGWLIDAGSAITRFHDTLTSGVVDAGYRVGAFARGVVSTVSGLPGQMVAIGGQIVSGLVSGIQNSISGAISAAANMAGQVAQAARNALGIRSPSRVFRTIGAQVGQGLHQGLLGSVDSIKATSEKLADAITDKFKAGGISKSVKNRALEQLKQATDGGSTLQELAKQRSSLIDQIADLKQSRTGVHDDTKAATVGAGDITSFASPGDAIEGLRGLVGKTKLFTADLKTLVKKGVKGSLLAQLVDGWNSDPDTALQTVQGLVQNPNDLKQIIGLQNQLSTAGAALGSFAGHAEYDTAINSKTAQKTVAEFTMQKIARDTLKSVARQTNITINLSGHYAGTRETLAKDVTSAIREAVKKGQLPKNILTAL